MQVLETSPTSAVFSIAMVVVYDECIISEVGQLSIGINNAFFSPTASHAMTSTCPLITSFQSRNCLGQHSGDANSRKKVHKLAKKSMRRY